MQVRVKRQQHACCDSAIWVTGRVNPRPGSTPGKLERVRPKPSTAINPLAPSASIPAYRTRTIEKVRTCQKRCSESTCNRRDHRTPPGIAKSSAIPTWFHKPCTSPCATAPPLAAHAQKQSHREHRQHVSPCRFQHQRNPDRFSACSCCNTGSTTVLLVKPGTAPTSSPSDQDNPRRLVTVAATSTMLNM